MVLACTVAIVVASVIGATWWYHGSQPADKRMTAHDLFDLINMVASFSLTFPLLAGFGNYMMKSYGMQFEHSDFVRVHSGKEWTQQERPEAGPDGRLIGEAIRRADPLGPPMNPEWMPNGQYFRTRNQMAIFFSATLAIFVISVIYILAAPDANETCAVLAMIGMLLGGISMFSIVLTGITTLGSLATHVSLGPQGINLKYRSERAPRHLIRSLAWGDIQDILHINELMSGKDTDMTNLFMKVNGGMKGTQIDRPYQRLILREWCRRNPESATAKKYARYAK